LLRSPISRRSCGLLAKLDQVRRYAIVRLLLLGGSLDMEQCRRG
jgi:hypothetical protein